MKVITHKNQFYNAIEFVSKKDFKKIKENNDDVQVVGMTNLSKWKEDKHSKKEDYNKLIIKKNDEEKQYLVKPKVYGFVDKYIKVEENKYIAIKYKFLILILLFLLGLMIIGGILLTKDTSKTPNIQIGGEEIQEYNPHYDYEEEMIEVPGLEKEYIVDSNNPEIYLTNPKGNTVYFKYEVFVAKGKSIYKSDYIPPNKMVRVNFYDLLDAGEYEINVTINTLDIETKGKCNSAQLETLVKVKK